MHGQAIKFLHFSFFFGFGLFLSLHFGNAAYAQEQGVDVGGWAWNSSMGWVSQRDVISDPSSKEKKGTFGVVKYDKDHEGKEKTGDDFIEGWSWSALYGFMCWGHTCETLCTRDQAKDNKCVSPQDVENLSGSIDPPDTDTKPSARITKKTVDVEDVYIKKAKQKKKLNIVQGWAKILTLKNQGWISLSGCTAALNKAGICPEGKSYGVYFDPDTQEFRGWAWSSLLGWLAFSGKTLYDTPYSYIENKKNGTRYEVKKDPSGKDIVVTSGYPEGVEVDIFIAANPDFERKLDSTACLSPALCEKVGFSEKLGKSSWRTQYVGPWVQTKGGTVEQTNIGTTIFSRKGFDLGTSGGFAAEQKYSGEYDLEYEEGGTKKKKTGVRGTSKVGVRCDVLTDQTGKETCSQAGKKRVSVSPDDQDVRAGALKLEFPKSSKTDKQKIVNSLGALQKKAFITKSDAGKRNVYGYEVRPFSELFKESLNQNELTAPLGGKIYLFTPTAQEKNLEIGSPSNRTVLTIPKSGSQVSAAGTIVAYGADIVIYRPIEYDRTANLNNLKQLASVAWLALQSDGVCKDEQGRDRPCGGRIIIDDCIPSQPQIGRGAKDAVPLAGLFFAEGEIRTGHGDGKKCLDAFKKAPYTNPSFPAATLTILKNAFQGGFSELDAPLTIEGVMIAAKFVLQRVYGGVDQGSEFILDTGRAQINPPPGIEDILRALPIK